MFTRKQILDAANKYYPDGYLANYYDEAGQQRQASGDTLAEFIVSELIETLDDKNEIIDRLESFRDRMDAALEDICLVLDGIKDLHNSIPGHEECWEDEDEEEEVELDFEGEDA